MLALSCVLVTYPIHLLPQAAHIATTTSYSYCLVIGSALRVVVHASAVLSRYRCCYLIGLYVGKNHGYFSRLFSGGIGGSAARFVTAHLCFLNNLGPEFLLSVPRLSALTTRGYAYRVSPRPLPESTALSSGHN